jgi:type 1 fimbriae regulatory protein FimB/type 1 fimbriae regulatory protein FimE
MARRRLLRGASCAECSQRSRITNTRGRRRPRRKGNSAMSDAAPTTENRTLRRLPNATYRQREYLTEAEVERLIEAARKRGRNGTRDGAAILLPYRHGLRAAELCQLRWSQIDLRQGRLQVNRAKGGCASVHPLHGPELRALRPLQGGGPYVFVTEAGTPVTTAWFLRMVQRTGVAAKLPFPVCPHMLRHSRIQARQRWPRYAIAGALPWTSQCAIDCALHGVGRREVREILARLGRICRRF